MPYYRLATRMEYYGQDIINVYWYRSITAFGALLDRLAVMNALAAEWKENFWDDRSPAHAGGYGLREILPDECNFADMTVQAWDDGIVAFTSDPVTIPVNQLGLVSGGTNGPAVCAIMKANLTPAIGPGIGLPKKGYLAIGPLMDSQIGSTGGLNTETQGRLQGLANRMALSIFTELPPDELEPIRVRLTRVAGVVTDIGWKTVASWAVRTQTSFRRSRQPEA